jgi:hypothetical protein
MKLNRNFESFKDSSKNKQNHCKLKKLAYKLERDYLSRTKKHEEVESIFSDRNSFSKTDHNATFMRIEGDSMLNDYLKLRYNL